MRKLPNCGHDSDKANRTLHPHKSYHYSCPMFLGSCMQYRLGVCVYFLLFWVGLGGVCLFVVVVGGVACFLFVCFNDSLFQLVR